MRKPGTSRKPFCLLSIAAVLFMCIFLARAVTVYAEYEHLDVSVYLGATVDELYRDFPGSLWEGTDIFSSGREFLTDGKVCFYYEYSYMSESRSDKKVNRIVLNNHCGSEYWIGSLPGGATPGDEYAGLETMDYELIFETADWRNIWKDDKGHLVIVTRGPFASACEIDYSMLAAEEEE